MQSRRWIPVLVLLALVVLPDVAHACPVCFDPREENRTAFLATTAFMSLFPLGMVGSLGMWLRKRSREAGEEAENEVDSTEE